MKTKTLVLLTLAVGTVVAVKKYGLIDRAKAALTPTPADPAATATKGCCG